MCGCVGVWEPPHTEGTHAPTPIRPHAHTPTHPHIGTHSGTSHCVSSVEPAQGRGLPLRLPHGYSCTYRQLSQIRNCSCSGCGACSSLPHTHTPLPVRCAMRIRCVSYTEGCLWIMGNARSLTSSSAPRPIMPIAQQPALALARASLAVASLDHRLRAIARHGTVGDKRGSPEYTVQWRPCKVRCPCCTRCYTQDCPAAHAVDVCLSNEPLVPPAQLLVGWLPAVDGGVVVVTGVRLTGDQREG